MQFFHDLEQGFSTQKGQNFKLPVHNSTKNSFLCVCMCVVWWGVFEIGVNKQGSCILSGRKIQIISHSNGYSDLHNFQVAVGEDFIKKN